MLLAPTIKFALANENIRIRCEKGIFHYITKDLEVDNHSHPAVEIIKAKKGTFSIETDFGKQNNLTFAIIDANMNHKMISEQNEIEFLFGIRLTCNTFTYLLAFTVGKPAL